MGSLSMKPSFDVKMLFSADPSDYFPWIQQKCTKFQRALLEVIQSQCISHSDLINMQTNGDLPSFDQDNFWRFKQSLKKGQSLRESLKEVGFPDRIAASVWTNLEPKMASSITADKFILSVYFCCLDFILSASEAGASSNFQQLLLSLSPPSTSQFNSHREAFFFAVIDAALDSQSVEWGEISLSIVFDLISVFADAEKEHFGLLLKLFEKARSPKMIDKFTVLLSHIISERRPIIDTAQLSSFMPAFGKFLKDIDPRFTKLVCQFSYLAQDSQILQFYSDLPTMITSILAEEQPKNLLTTFTNEAPNSNGNMSEIKLLDSFSLPNIEEVNPEDVLTSLSSAKMVSICASLQTISKSSNLQCTSLISSSVSDFISSNPNNPYIIDFLIIVVGSLQSFPLSDIAQKILNSPIFSESLTIFDIAPLPSNVQNLRSAVFQSLIRSNPNSIAAFIEAFGTDSFITAELIARSLYYINSFDSSLFLTESMLSLLLRIISRMGDIHCSKRDSSLARSTAFLFIFDLLDSPSSSLICFSSKPFCLGFLGNLFEEGLSQPLLTKLSESISKFQSLPQTVLEFVCDIFAVFSKHPEHIKLIEVVKKLSNLIVESMKSNPSLLTNSETVFDSMLSCTIAFPCTELLNNVVEMLILSSADIKVTDEKFHSIVKAYHSIDSNYSMLNQIANLVAKSSNLMENPTFLIQQPGFLQLMLAMFANSIYFDNVLTLLKNLCEYSESNCEKCHESEVEALLIESMDERIFIRGREIKVQKYSKAEISLISDVLTKIFSVVDNSIRLLIEMIIPKPGKHAEFALDILQAVIAAKNAAPSFVFPIGMSDKIGVLESIDVSSLSGGFLFIFWAKFDLPYFLRTNYSVSFMEMTDSIGNSISILAQQNAILIRMKRKGKMTSVSFGPITPSGKWEYFIVSFAFIGPEIKISVYEDLRLVDEGSFNGITIVSPSKVVIGKSASVFQNCFPITLGPFALLPPSFDISSLSQFGFDGFTGKEEKSTVIFDWSLFNPQRPTDSIKPMATFSDLFSLVRIADHAFCEKFLTVFSSFADTIIPTKLVYRIPLSMAPSADIKNLIFKRCYISDDTWSSLNSSVQSDLIRRNFSDISFLISLLKPVYSVYKSLSKFAQKSHKYSKEIMKTALFNIWLWSSDEQTFSKVLSHMKKLDVGAADSNLFDSFLIQSYLFINYSQRKSPSLSDMRFSILEYIGSSSISQNGLLLILACALKSRNKEEASQYLTLMSNLISYITPDPSTLDCIFQSLPELGSDAIAQTVSILQSVNTFRGFCELSRILQRSELGILNLRSPIAICISSLILGGSIEKIPLPYADFTSELWYFWPLSAACRNQASVPAIIEFVIFGIKESKNFFQDAAGSGLLIEVFSALGFLETSVVEQFITGILKAAPITENILNLTFFLYFFRLKCPPLSKKLADEVNSLDYTEKIDISGWKHKEFTNLSEFIEAISGCEEKFSYSSEAASNKEAINSLNKIWLQALNTIECQLSISTYIKTYLESEKENVEKQNSALILFPSMDETYSYFADDIKRIKLKLGDIVRLPKVSNFQADTVLQKASAVEYNSILSFELHSKAYMDLFSQEYNSPKSPFASISPSPTLTPPKQPLKIKQSKECEFVKSDSFPFQSLSASSQPLLSGSCSIINDNAAIGADYLLTNDSFSIEVGWRVREVPIGSITAIFEKSSTVLSFLFSSYDALEILMTEKAHSDFVSCIRALSVQIYSSLSDVKTIYQSNYHSYLMYHFLKSGSFHKVSDLPLIETIWPDLSSRFGGQFCYDVATFSDAEMKGSVETISALSSFFRYDPAIRKAIQSKLCLSSQQIELKTLFKATLSESPVEFGCFLGTNPPSVFVSFSDNSQRIAELAFSPTLSVWANREVSNLKLSKATNVCSPGRSVLLFDQSSCTVTKMSEGFSAISSICPNHFTWVGCCNNYVVAISDSRSVFRSSFGEFPNSLTLISNERRKIIKYSISDSHEAIAYTTADGRLKCIKIGDGTIFGEFDGLTEDIKSVIFADNMGLILVNTETQIMVFTICCHPLKASHFCERISLWTVVDTAQGSYAVFEDEDGKYGNFEVLHPEKVNEMSLCERAACIGPHSPSGSLLVLTFDGKFIVLPLFQ